jgi:hypothetical protein
LLPVGDNAIESPVAYADAHTPLLPIGDTAIEFGTLRSQIMNVHGFESNPVEILKVAGGHQGLSRSPSGGPIG